jgi:hypothetical protein
LRPIGEPNDGFKPDRRVADLEGTAAVFRQMLARECERLTELVKSTLTSRTRQIGAEGHP